MSMSLNDPRIANGMRAQMTLRRKMLDGGAKQIGWKVGLGAPASMERLKITAPVVGYILDSAPLPSGATVSLAGWVKPMAEAEIAVYLGHDLPGNADRETGTVLDRGDRPGDRTGRRQRPERRSGARARRRHLSAPCGAGAAG